jgi:SAM-dependent methyltransferase
MSAIPTPDSWEQHWERFGAAAESSPASRYRWRMILELLDLEHQPSGVRMLEIGSGTGKFAEDFYARSREGDYLGLELSRSGIALASRRVPQARFLQRDLLLEATPEQRVDFQATNALCSEGLEHVDDPLLLMRNASAFMGKNCRLIATVPDGPMNAFYRHIGHRRHYRPAELAGILEKAGFQIERAFNAGFPFFDLYRVLVGLRGNSMITDALQARPGLLIRIGEAVFDFLFRFNLTGMGWQTIVVARYRGA